MMRVLKNDFSRYMEVEEDEIGEEETGWKLINGDVFDSLLLPMGLQLCLVRVHTSYVLPCYF
jgi:hypothetical protein